MAAGRFARASSMDLAGGGSAGGDLDPGGEFVPAFVFPVGDELRSVFPALLPVISSFPYVVLGTRGIYLLPALCAILCMAATARLALRLMPEGEPGRRWAALAGIASVVSTPAVFYGATFWEHSLGTLLVVCALIPILDAAAGATRRARAGVLLAAGAALGVASMARTETALLIPSVIAVGAWTRGWRAFARPAAAIGAGATLVLVPQALYHRAVYASIVPPHVGANLAGGALHRTNVGLLYNLEMLAPVRWRAAAAVILVAAAVTVLWPRARRFVAARRDGRMAALGGLALTGFLFAAGPLYTLMLRLSGPALSTHDRGFQSLIHTMPLVCLLPLVALAPPRPDADGPRPAVRFVWGTIALYVALVVALAPVPGGLAWGPRLLLAVVPLLSVAIVAAVAGRHQGPFRRAALGALAVTLAGGVALQVLGLRFMVTVRSHNAALIQSVRETVPEGGVVVSDFFPVPQLLTTLSGSRPALYAHDGAALDALAARLEAAGRPVYRIEWSRGPARTEGVDLGGGLRLVRDRGDAGVGGFLRMPRGD